MGRFLEAFVICPPSGTIDVGVEELRIERHREPVPGRNIQDFLTHASTLDILPKVSYVRRFRAPPIAALDLERI